MYEVARRCRRVLALFENGKFVANTRISQLTNAQPDFYHIRKSQRSKVSALRLCCKCNYFPGCDIQTTFCDQILVDRRIEESVVQRIVNMSVNVVVHPTRRQRHK